MHTPHIPEHSPGTEGLMQQVIAGIGNGMAAVPHAEVAAARVLLDTAEAALLQVAQESNASGLVQAAGQVSLAAAMVQRVQGQLRHAASEFTAYVRDVGGPDMAPATEVAAPSHRETPPETPRETPPEIIEAADAAQYHLAPLAQAKSTTAYREALTAYPDDVLCELLRRDVPLVAETLYLRHKGFLYQQARRILPASQTLFPGYECEDLVQGSIEEFLLFCTRYTGGAKLLSYTGIATYGRMIKNLYQEAFRVYVPRSAYESVLDELRAIDLGRASRGEPPLTHQEIHERFGLPLNQAQAYAKDDITVPIVRRTEQLVRNMAATDTTARRLGVDPGEFEAAEIIGAEPAADPLDMIIDKETVAAVHAVVARLTVRQAAVIRGRFGLNAEGAMKTQQQIADEEHVARQYVSNTEPAALAKMARLWPELRWLLRSDWR